MQEVTITLFCIGTKNLCVIFSWFSFKEGKISQNLVLVRHPPIATGNRRSGKHREKKPLLHAGKPTASSALTALSFKDKRLPAASSALPTPSRPGDPPSLSWVNRSPETIPVHNSCNANFTLPCLQKMKTTKGNFLHTFPKLVVRYGGEREQHREMRLQETGLISRELSLSASKYSANVVTI